MVVASWDKIWHRRWYGSWQVWFTTEAPFLLELSFELPRVCACAINLRLVGIALLVSQAGYRSVEAISHATKEELAEARDSLPSTCVPLDTLFLACSIRGFGWCNRRPSSSTRGAAPTRA